jgi:hypothetical protein
MSSCFLRFMRYLTKTLCGPYRWDRFVSATPQFCSDVRNTVAHENHASTSRDNRIAALLFRYAQYRERVEGSSYVRGTTLKKLFGFDLLETTCYLRPTFLLPSRSSWSSTLERSTYTDEFSGSSTVEFD